MLRVLTTNRVESVSNHRRLFPYVICRLHRFNLGEDNANLLKDVEKVNDEITRKQDEVEEEIRRLKVLQ